MSYLWQCTRKDLLRRMADPMALLIWIGIPLVLGGLITLISSDGAPPRVRVLLVDQDDSFVSGLLVGAFIVAGEVLRAMRRAEPEPPTLTEQIRLNASRKFD